MTRVEFLRQLAQNLADLPPEERQAALDYYTEYLEEAGPEREAQVLAELGDPAQVAAAIRDGRPQDRHSGENAPPRYAPPRYQAAPGSQPEDKNWLVLVILLCTAPVWGSFVLGALALLLGMGAASVGLLFGAVCVALLALTQLTGSLGTVLVFLGIALLLAAGGFLLMAGFAWVMHNGFPIARRILHWAVDAVKGLVQEL